METEENDKKYEWIQKTIDHTKALRDLNYENKNNFLNLKENVNLFFDTFKPIYPTNCIISKSEFDSRGKKLAKELKNEIITKMENYIISWKNDLRLEILRLINIDDTYGELLYYEFEKNIIDSLIEFITILCDDVLLNKLINNTIIRSMNIHGELIEKDISLVERFNIKTLFVLYIGFENNKFKTEIFSKTEVLKFNISEFDEETQEEIIKKLKEIL